MFRSHTQRDMSFPAPAEKCSQAVPLIRADPRFLALSQYRTFIIIGNVRERDYEFREAVEAKPVDSGENLVVLTPDDDGVF
jgi:hypothetical protein